MANYNVGNIEIGVISNSAKALSSLDKTIAKLQEFKKIDATLQNIFLRINQLGNGLTKISKINVDVLNSKIENADSVIANLKTKGGALNPYTISEVLALTESKSNIYIKGIVSYKEEPNV